MEHFGEFSLPVQRIMIGVVFLVVLIALVILRDMIKTEESASAQG
jgi:hypothetical protein